MTSRAPLVMAALALALTGCQDPYARPPRGEASTRPPTPPPRGDERPPPADDRDTAPEVGADPRATPQAAIDAFCAQWANWSWRTIERQQRRLAQLATGRLARQLAAEAALRAQDKLLRRDRLGVRGRVIAIDVKSGARTRDAVCVTREQQQANGRADPEGARHRVYLATAVHARGGWTIRRWEPQP